MTCPTPHSMRVGLDIHPDLEVMGSHGTDCWARCRRCGRWFWLVSDEGGKWDYFDQWELDRGLAERAFLHADVDAAAELLVSSDLPYGPVWTTASALLEMLRAITPKATDGERNRALSAIHPAGRWAEAAKLLDEIATALPPTAGDLPFAVDVTFSGRRFSESREVGRSLVLLQSSPSHALVRVDARAVSEMPLAGPARVLASAGNVLLFAVTTGTGEAVCRIDDAGTSSTFPPEPTRYGVSSLDDGWWLFVPEDDANVRFVEFHRPDAQPRVKLRIAFEPNQSFPCLPRRMGNGWIVSGCVDVEEQEQALSLLDGSFRMIAQSTGAHGPRVITPIGAEALWCETAKHPFVLERWVRRGDKLERTFELDVQSWARVDGGIIVSPRDVGSGITGYDDDGSVRFRLDDARSGATYFASVPGGMLVYDNAVARFIDPRTGEAVASSFTVEQPAVFGASNGTAYLRDRAALWVFDGGARARIFVGEDMNLETTCGDGALLRDGAGQCLLFDPSAAVRGRFSAPAASFSVVGTRGGPYVIEESDGNTRLRIARFA